MDICTVLSLSSSTVWLSTYHFSNLIPLLPSRLSQRQNDRVACSLKPLVVARKIDLALTMLGESSLLITVFFFQQSYQMSNGGNLRRLWMSDLNKLVTDRAIPNVVFEGQ